RGITTNRFTLTDPSGNSSTCAFTVTVIDAQPPSVTCPANITVNAAAGQCASNVTFNVTAADTCGATTVTSSPPSGFAFPVGTTTVTSTATDSSGNTSRCTFTVTVLDKQPPSIICPADITVNAAPGQCGSNVTFTVTATDNCSVTNLVSSPSGGVVLFFDDFNGPVLNPIWQPGLPNGTVGIIGGVDTYIGAPNYSFGA